jgi:hypothetical protein
LLGNATNHHKKIIQYSGEFLIYKTMKITIPL